MISSRTDTVHRAVALIDPDKHRRAECDTAVRVALVELNASEADLRRIWERNSKAGRRTALQLETAITNLLGLLDDPIASNLAKKAETKWVLKLWQRRAGSMARDKITPPFRFGAQKKLSAAAQALFLLKRFDREIAATEGSTFCRLAALLHGTPKAKFQSPCRMIHSHPLRLLDPFRAKAPVSPSRG